ncbi:MAG TPA: hypothetical protein VD788_00330 [Candidatus Polarisedimenticolaceae bacterium]|nr:hypothetical protein [Candidatus Polarisedimenticolaceae bacterium]
MRSATLKITVVAVGFAAATVGVLVFAMLGQAQVECEVCITFHGRTQCRQAAGPDRESAIRTATDNACAFLAAGMSDSISCANTPPDVVTCDD